MDLVFFGTPKTATTSLFDMLSHHPEIGPSVEKEYYNSFIINDLNSFISDHYEMPYDISSFDVDFQTKVLLDGSSNVFTFVNEGMLDKIKTRTKVNNIKCIYVLRNPIDRFLSSIKETSKRINERYSWYERFPNKKMSSDGKIAFNRCVLLWLIIRSDINNLFSIETIFSRKNMFICKLKELEQSQKEIYQFLDINDSYYFKLPKLNISSYENDDEIIAKVRNNRKQINKMCIQSLRSIKSIYNINTDDLILDVLQRKI